MILKISFLFGLLALCSATSDAVAVPDPQVQAPVASDPVPVVADAAAPVPLVHTQDSGVVAQAPAAGPPDDLAAAPLKTEVPADASSVQGAEPPVLAAPGQVAPLAENSGAGPVIAEPVESSPHTIIPPASPVVADPVFIKLYPQEHSGGIYRTEKGEYVRLFKVLNLPPGFDGVPVSVVPEAPIPINPGVPRPMSQRFAPFPLQLRSPLGPAPMMMGRSAGVGKTGRYYDDYMYSNPYAYNQLYNPYYNGYANYPYSYAYNYNYSPYLM